MLENAAYEVQQLASNTVAIKRFLPTLTSSVTPLAKRPPPHQAAAAQQAKEHSPSEGLKEKPSGVEGGRGGGQVSLTEGQPPTATGATGREGGQASIKRPAEDRPSQMNFAAAGGVLGPREEKEAAEAMPPLEQW